MTSPLLEVTELACRRGGRRVFADLSFALQAGEMLVLTGPNGSGKTTLLRALALLVPRDRGAIRWQGADVAHDRDAWRRQLAWLGHQEGLKGDLTVAENLLLARRLRGDGADRPGIERALAAFDLAALAGRPVRTLSAGQRRRAALARVMTTEARLWLIDEPLAALDRVAERALGGVLERWLGDGGLVIAATHAPLGLAGARTLGLGAARAVDLGARQ